MKKYIIITICIIIVGSSLLLLKKIIEVDKHNEQKSHVESFRYLTLEEKNETFNLNNIQNTLFIYFNSKCEYCQIKARDILENKDLIKKYELFFISDEEVNEITKFSKEWKLDNEKNIHFLKDVNHSFKNQFNIKYIPSIVFYNINNVVFYKGSYSIKYILNEAYKKNNS